MRLLLIITLFATASALANTQKQYPSEESDAFHNSAFGASGNITPENQQDIQQQEEIPEAPQWVIPEESELPERQEEELIPKDRVNQWQEQSNRASGEE